MAPFDVVLDEHTVVQPDVCMVCDPAQIVDGRCVGAPRFIAEVLIPSTAHKDRHVKLRLYEQHRVPEYLIVDPGDGWAVLYTLDAEHFYGDGRPVPLDEMLNLAGAKLDTSLREIVELEPSAP